MICSGTSPRPLRLFLRLPPRLQQQLCPLSLPPSLSSPWLSPLLSLRPLLPPLSHPRQPPPSRCVLVLKLLLVVILYSFFHPVDLLLLCVMVFLQFYFVIGHLPYSIKDNSSATDDTDWSRMEPICDICTRINSNPPPSPLFLLCMQ